MSLSYEQHAKIVETAAKNWPYAISHRTHLLQPSEAREWCTEHFGPRGNLYPPSVANTVEFELRHRWVESGSEFRFKDERDAIAFKLRWV